MNVIKRTHKWKRLFTKTILSAILVGVLSFMGVYTPIGTSVSTVSAATSNVQAGFIRGVDLSTIISYENSGQKFYYADGTQGDIFDILKDAGVNYVRIKIWNNPYDTSTGSGYGGGNSDLTKAIAIGKRATEHGMLTLIDFHYSDFWADPEKQYSPKAWTSYTNAQKATAVYDFTYNSLQSILDAGVKVGMVQIGNETNGSMAGMGGLYDGTWNLTTGVGAAMQKGCEAVNAINTKYGLTGDDKILKALHFTDPTTNASWYAQCVNSLGIDYDVFAISAYPFWHGTATDIGTVLKSIAKTYNKKVMVAETAYPYTYTNGDTTANNVSSASDMNYTPYAVSVAGQTSAVKEILEAVASVNAQSGTSGYGLGGFYWEPSYIGTSTSNTGTYGTGWASSVSGNYEKLFKSTVSFYSTSNKGSSWDNMAMFNSSGVALSSLSAFKSIGVTAYDKTAINNLITTANALSSSNYTTASWAILTTAKAKAVTVSTDDYATALDISSAISNLQSAINSLVSSGSGSTTGTNKTWNFSNSAFTGLGTISSSTTVDSLGLNATTDKYLEVKSNSQTLSGTTYSYCLALGGAGSIQSRSVAIPVSGNCTITVIGKSSGTDTRTLAVANASGTTLGTLSESSTISSQTYTYTGQAGTIYLYSLASGINLYSIAVTY